MSVWTVIYQFDGTNTCSTPSWILNASSLWSSRWSNDVQLVVYDYDALAQLCFWQRQEVEKNLVQDMASENPDVT